MTRFNDSFSHQVWQNAMQFQNETSGTNNDLYEFLLWLDKQANAKEIYKWANDVNNYAAQRYTVETFVKGRNVVVYVGNEEDNIFSRGSAHCSKRDNFDSNIGRAIAIYRALEDMRETIPTDLEPPFEI